MQENEIKISQSVAILIDGNNIERSLTTMTGDEGAMLNFDSTIPKLLRTRTLNRLIYFREGRRISSKLGDRLHENYYGSVIPCHKSADIPLTIKATQLSSKVDTIIIVSGDSDYIELVKHLQGEGVRVEIAAVENNTAQVLRERCDYYHPITEEDQFVYLAGRAGGGRSSKKVPAKPQTQSKTQSQSKSKPDSKPDPNAKPKSDAKPNSDAKDLKKEAKPKKATSKKVSSTSKAKTKKTASKKKAATRTSRR